MGYVIRLNRLACNGLLLSPVLSDLYQDVPLLYSGVVKVNTTLVVHTRAPPSLCVSYLTRLLMVHHEVKRGEISKIRPLFSSSSFSQRRRKLLYSSRTRRYIFTHEPAHYTRRRRHSGVIIFSIPDPSRGSTGPYCERLAAPSSMWCPGVNDDVIAHVLLRLHFRCTPWASYVER